MLPGLRIVLKQEVPSITPRSEEGNAGGEAAADDVSGLRRLLLAVVLLGIVGLGAELVFLEHWESRLQWLPFGGLTLGLFATVLAWRSPGRRVLRTFQGIMSLFVVLGLLGLWLHYRGNALFELEMDATSQGLALVRRALFGAIPFLAPGALAQMGLVGLAATYRHPALRRGARENRS